MFKNHCQDYHPDDVWVFLQIGHHEIMFFFHHPQSQVKIRPVIVVVCFRNPELALNLNMKGRGVIWGLKLSWRNASIYWFEDIWRYPPVIKHGLLENTLFVGDFPIEPPIFSGFPIATFDYRRVCLDMLKISKDVSRPSALRGVFGAGSVTIGYSVGVPMAVKIGIPWFIMSIFMYPIINGHFKWVHHGTSHFPFKSQCFSG